MILDFGPFHCLLFHHAIFVVVKAKLFVLKNFIFHHTVMINYLHVVKLSNSLTLLATTC